MKKAPGLIKKKESEMSQNRKPNDKRRAKRTGRAILRRALLVLLGLLLGVGVYVVNAQKLTRSQLPMPFGTGVAVVLSGSMEPTLHVGDLLIVRRADAYHEGEIVVFQDRDALIVHRIVAVDGETIVTRGDANNTDDSPITPDVIQGVVVAHIPYVGNVFNILRTPAGIILIFLLAIVLIESSFRKDKRTEDEEREAIKEEIRRLSAERKNDTENKE